MKKVHTLGLSALALAALGTLGLAQIKELSLTEIVTESDEAVFGEITRAHVFRVDDPLDGPELFYTTLTIQGVSLVDGAEITLDVTYHGGFVSPTEGVYNSEAPAADDVKLGNQVVAFSKWSDMGAGVWANGLYAAHGGLYRTVEGPGGTMVLGRGQGYAIPKNLKLSDLSTAVSKIAAEKLERKGR